MKAAVFLQYQSVSRLDHNVLGLQRSHVQTPRFHLERPVTGKLETHERGLLAFICWGRKGPMGKGHTRQLPRMDQPVAPLMAQVISCTCSLCGVISLSHLLYLELCHTVSLVLVVRFLRSRLDQGQVVMWLEWQTVLCQPARDPGGSWTGPRCWSLSQTADLLLVDAAWVAAKREFDELYSFFGSMQIPPHWTTAFSGFQRGQFWTVFWLGLLDPEGHCVDLREPTWTSLRVGERLNPTDLDSNRWVMEAVMNLVFILFLFLLNKTSLVFCFFLTNRTRHNIAKKKKKKHLSRTYPFEAQSQIQKHRNICSVWYIYKKYNHKKYTYKTRFFFPNVWFL